MNAFIHSFINKIPEIPRVIYGYTEFPIKVLELPADGGGGVSLEISKDFKNHHYKGKRNKFRRGWCREKRAER